MFADPEFKKLNPAVQPVTGYGSAFQVPTVQSGHSDMTWTVTRWIAANADASKFQQGTPDPWGMRVNSYDKGLKYPLDSFTAMDPYPVIAHKYSPVFPLSLADSYQAENWDPGTSWQKDQYGNYPKDPIQIPGERALIAILDEASAAAFRFPVAAIPNAAGHYVEPTNAGMAGALGSMTPAGSGTLQMNLQGGNPAAYPLTMVIYAMVPISGVAHTKAAAIARFLDFAAGSGQTPRRPPGQLPAGYLPLPANLRAQTRKAAVEVANQTGNQSPGHSGNPAGPGSSRGAGAHAASFFFFLVLFFRGPIGSQPVSLADRRRRVRIRHPGQARRGRAPADVRAHPLRAAGPADPRAGPRLWAARSRGWDRPTLPSPPGSADCAERDDDHEAQGHERRGGRGARRGRTGRRGDPGAKPATTCPSADPVLPGRR